LAWHARDAIPQPRPTRTELEHLILSITDRSTRIARRPENVEAFLLAAVDDLDAKPTDPAHLDGNRPPVHGNAAAIARCSPSTS
jgi:hypothetical protein